MDPFTLKVNRIIDQKLGSMTNMAVGNHYHNTYDSNQLDPAISLLGFPVIQVANATTAPTDKPNNGTFRFYVDTTPRCVMWTYTVYQTAATVLMGQWTASTTAGVTTGSGTYTPTLTGVANVGASTAYVCQYLRVGNVVTVSGKVDVDPTLGISTTTQLGITLPIASNFGALEQCAGTASSPAIATQQGGIYADAANDRAQLDFKAIDPNNNSWYFTFTYQII